MAMRRVLAATLALAAVVTACGGDDVPCGADPGADDTISIGLITDLSGRFVGFGRDIEAATCLAVQKVNDEGGVNGSLLAVQLRDSAGEEDQAVLDYGVLERSGVVAVSGPISSGEAEVVFAQAATAGVPVITGTANKAGITERGAGWAFRNTATNDALYAVAMPAWADHYGIETAVLIYDRREPVSAAAAETSIPGVADDVGVTLTDDSITIERGQSDFATTVQRIRDIEADGLIIITAPAEAGLLARELVRRGETRPILGHPAQASDTFYAQGGDQINDWVLPSIFDDSVEDATTVEYLAAMNDRIDEPPPVPEAANYYDNILILAHVMREAGVTAATPLAEAREAIRDGLRATTDFAGAAGSITFLETGDTVKTVYVNVVIAGEVQPLG